MIKITSPGCYRIILVGPRHGSATIRYFGAAADSIPLTPNRPAVAAYIDKPEWLELTGAVEVSAATEADLSARPEPAHFVVPGNDAMRATTIAEVLREIEAVGVPEFYLHAINARLSRMQLSTPGLWYLP